MAKSIERYMRFIPNPKQPRLGERRWSPAADVYRTKDGWLVKVDLAGVSLDEIEISVAGPLLSIEGTRRDAFCSETVSYHQLEITYSRFEKTLRFPCPIEGAHIESNYQDGLLLLRLRSPEECE
jgi:HSP20 family protein